MFFDEAWKHGDSVSLNFILTEIADALRDHMLGLHDPLSEKRWRLAGYRFADFLAHNSLKGIELTREFANGMRIFAEENSRIGPPILYDTNHAASIEARAHKFLSLVTHANADANEAQNASRGFIKLFGRGDDSDLAIIASERLSALNQTLTRVQDTIAFMKKEHPMLFLWKRDERAP